MVSGHTADGDAMVANGLLLIFLGLLHVAYWRFFASHERPLVQPERPRSYRARRDRAQPDGR